MYRPDLTHLWYHIELLAMVKKIWLHFLSWIDNFKAKVTIIKNDLLPNFWAGLEETILVAPDSSGGHQSCACDLIAYSSFDMIFL